MSSYKYDKNNIFFKIINNQVSSDKVYQDDDLIIINDIYPVAEHHFLAIPTIECVNYDHFLEVADKEVIVIFFVKIKHFINKMSIQDNCRIIMNNGLGQTIRHYHVHIISGNTIKKDEILEQMQ